jgi:putative salt-induced outer membrane protein YdiY
MRNFGGVLISLHFVLWTTVNAMSANETRFKTSMSIGASLQTGNSNNEDYNAAHSFKLTNQQLGYQHKVQALYGSSSKGVYRDYLNLSNTLDYVLSPKWEYFIFQYSERDTVANLEYSIYAGTGFKYRFLNNPTWKLDISTAPVYRFQHYTGNETGRQPAISNRFRLFYTHGKNLTFKNIFFYVPVIPGTNSLLYTGDYASISSSLIAGLTKSKKTKLGLEVKYLLRYQQSPPIGLKNTDYSLSLALKFAYDSSK